MEDFVRDSLSGFKRFCSPIFGELRKIGQSLFLPIAVLPIAAVFLRIGADDVLNNRFLLATGKAIFDHLPVLFAICIAGGLAKDRDISAGLAGAIAHFTIYNVTKVVKADNDLMIFGGLIAGLVGAYCYRYFSKVKLPVFLSFFGGRRFVPLMAGALSVVIGFILGYLWPSVNEGIFSAARWVTEKGSLGVFFYGVLDRLLVPFGLQSIVEKFAYFMLPGDSPFKVDGKEIVGDLTRFFSGDPNAGRFMSGFYPVMIFGLPAAALVMYLAAPITRRPAVAGLFLSAALTSMLTGVTEPIEFSFFFFAPILYIVHGILMGFSFVLAHLMGLRAGFVFSGGLIDMMLAWKDFEKPGAIFILGALFFSAYFLIFGLLIYFLRLKTPGRDEKSMPFSSFGSGAGAASSVVLQQKDQKYKDLAPLYIEAFGGKDNFKELTNCVTRLKIKLNDINKIDEDQIKSLGAMSVVKLSDTVQVTIGADVEFLASEMQSNLGFS